MSTTKTFCGITYYIPVRKEVGWGDNVTNLLSDLTDKLDGTFQSVTASGAATTIDFANGRNVKLTLNASTTITLSNPISGLGCSIYVKQGGSYTIAWPSTVKWRGGLAPTITTGAGARDLIGMIYESVDNIYLGDFSQDFS